MAARPTAISRRAVALRHAVAILLAVTACRPTSGGTTPPVASSQSVAPARAADTPIGAPRDPPAAPPQTDPRVVAPTDRPSDPPTDGPTDRAPDRPIAERPRTPPTEAFDRGRWAGWIDADGDCQDTRTEVLVAESEVPVVFVDDDRCEVASGRWRCPYTDRTFTDPRRLDVDHLVPLAHAHDAGASAWDDARRRRYANALDDADHLVAVDRSANRSKGARTVLEWLPEEPGTRCEYVAAWRRIKHTWALVESAEEHRAIDDMLALCKRGGVPERSGARATPATADPDPAEPPGACCRVCRAGKPCGDGCIAKDKTCTKPVGCACGPEA